MRALSAARDGAVVVDVRRASIDVLSALASAGSCATAPDPDAWHPTEPRREEIAESGRAEYVALARTLCAGCPAADACLELALRMEARTGRSHGVWGGTAPWEREQLIRARRARQRRVDVLAVAAVA